MRITIEAGQKAVSFAAGRTRTDLDDDEMLAFTLMKAASDA